MSLPTVNLHVNYSNVTAPVKKPDLLKDDKGSKSSNFLPVERDKQAFYASSLYAQTQSQTKVLPLTLLTVFHGWQTEIVRLIVDNESFVRGTRRKIVYVV
jgi:hypothetical protein